MAAQAIATVDPGDLAHRHVGGRDQYTGILAPDVLLGAVVKQRQLPVVNGHHAQYPGGGHAALGQCHLHPEEHSRVHLITLVAGRLHDAEEARILHLAYRGFRQVAEAGGLPLALLQDWNHLAGAAVEALNVVQLLCGHGLSP